MRVEYYLDADKKWRQRVIADNGKIVFPPEGYENLRDCVNITERLLGGDYAEALKNSTVSYKLPESPDFQPIGEYPANVVPEQFAHTPTESRLAPREAPKAGVPNMNLLESGRPPVEISSDPNLLATDE